MEQKSSHSPLHITLQYLDSHSHRLLPIHKKKPPSFID